MSDDDELDGCELDFTVDPDDDETAELRPLFPQGLETPDLEAKAQEWRAVAEQEKGAPDGD